MLINVTSQLRIQFAADGESQKTRHILMPSKNPHPVPDPVGRSIIETGRGTEHGAAKPAAPAQQDAEIPTTADGLNALTVAQLKGIAATLEVEDFAGMNKGPLVDAILVKQAAAADNGGAAGDNE